MLNLYFPWFDLILDYKKTCIHMLSATSTGTRIILIRALFHRCSYLELARNCKKLLVHNICGSRWCSATTSLSIELLVTSFCFLEVLYMDPAPRDKVRRRGKGYFFNFFLRSKNLLWKINRFLSLNFFLFKLYLLQILSTGRSRRSIYREC
jgi:hypothetical protein